MPLYQFLSTKHNKMLEEQIELEWKKHKIFSLKEFTELKTIEEKFAKTVLNYYLRVNKKDFTCTEDETSPILPHIVKLYSYASVWLRIWCRCERDDYEDWLTNQVLPSLIESLLERLGGNWKYELDWAMVSRFLGVSPSHFYKERDDWKPEDRYDGDANSSGEITDWVDYGEAVSPPAVGEVRKKVDTWYKVLDTKSPAHKELCQELERQDFMFWFEAPCNLPGYTGSKTGTIRSDLVVVHNRKVVVVEIDGESHWLDRNQYQKDRDRDGLISTNHIKHLRLEYNQVDKKQKDVIERIVAFLKD